MSLMIIGLSVSAPTLEIIFADEMKNDENNCNEIKKIKNSSPNIECEVDIEIKDHNEKRIPGLPILIIDPTSGPAGTSVNVTGLNFNKHSQVNILFDSDIMSTTPKFVEPNNNGVLSAFFTVPDTAIGTHDVVAQDKYDAEIAAGETFEVTSVDASPEPPSTSTLPF
jgi:IPT/TIG domain